MSVTRVVSLAWGSAWERYAKRFADSFAEFWPDDVELVMVADRDYCHPRAEWKLLRDIQGYQKFLDRWGADPAARGRRPPKGTKVDAEGYSWRHDAVKWMPQALAPLAALEGMQDGDTFVWLDADVLTKKSVPAGWVGALLAGADVACLQRPGTHSEIGFYAMKVGRGTRAALEIFARAYTSNVVFELKEQHSAFVWDWALTQVLPPSLAINNLNVTGVRGHPWPEVPLLADVTIHLKGKRKH
jgi:hypothetical protein